MTRLRIGFAVRTAIRLAALGAAAFALTAISQPAFAGDLQVSELQPQLQTVSVNVDAAPATAALQQAAGELTPSVLAAYVARQQAQKGFNIFGEAQQPQLTTAVLSAYAATHYQNAALAAIDTAASGPVPLRMTFTDAEADEASTGTADDAPSITPDTLADYARHGFLPTDKRIAQANQEKNCLSAAIYHEARGESDDGQWAVANVIINRAMSKRFPTTMCGVVYQNANQGRFHCQFTFACDGHPDAATERQALMKANRIAAAAYSEFQRGQRPGVIPGSALYYHTRAVNPGWSNVYHRVAQIGAHVFYAPT